MLKNYFGREPSSEPFLRAKGLVAGDDKGKVKKAEVEEEKVDKLGMSESD